MNGWLRTMRCLVCNSEMLLIEAVQADANTLPGFQHHTFLCSPCHDVERRLVFTGVKTITATAPPDLPASKVSGGGAPNAWARAVEKLLSRQAALKGDALAKRSSERRAGLEKLQSGQTTTNERPLLPRTPDIVSAFNRIWPDPRPNNSAQKSPTRTPSD
jgi:hypothetical protein